MVNVVQPSHGQSNSSSISPDCLRTATEAPHDPRRSLHAPLRLADVATTAAHPTGGMAGVDGEASLGDEPPATTDTHASPTEPGALEAIRPLSRQSGAVNALHAPQIRQALAARGLNTGGTKKVLARRLKQHLRALARKEHQEAGGEAAAGGGEGDRALETPPETPFDYLCVVDFEATCERGAKDFPHEIIEFPVVLVDCHSCKTVRGCAAGSGGQEVGLGVSPTALTPYICPLLRRFRWPSSSRIAGPLSTQSSPHSAPS